MISSRMVARRIVAAIVSAALALIGLSVFALPEVAHADTAPDPGVVSTVSADALPTWQINGVVWNQVIVGNTVYVTGSFTKARPPGVAKGGAGEITANNIFAYDITTGNRVASFNHSLNAQGLVITKSPDGSRVFVGGDFTTVDGIARGHVASFVTATGAMDPSFTANVNGQVRGLAASPATLYIGGNYQAINSSARASLGAVTYTGGLLPWSPRVDNGYVWTMVLAPDSSRVIVGGSFTTLSGTAAYGMGSLDATSGAALPWAANKTIQDGGAYGAITSLKTDGNQIFGGGYSFGSGTNFEGTFAADPSTGEITVVNDCHGDTYDVAPIGGVLYSVSHAHDCTWIGGWPDTNPRTRWQKAVAQTIAPYGTNTGPDSYGWNYAGLPDSRILQWFPNLSFGNYTSAGQAAWSVTGTSDYVVLGGEFPSVNGTAQQGLVRFARTGLAPNKSGPTFATNPARPTPPTTATSLASGTARVSFGTAWDEDNESLTYDVLRDNKTWVSSTKIKSNFWTLPSGGFTDTRLAPGSTHYYQVRITDPFGNTLWGPKSNTVTIGSAVTSQYAQDVGADGAAHYWRLGEASGSVGYDWAGFDDLNVNAAVGRGATGAILGDSDAASTFDGSSASAVDPNAIVGPNVFSEEAWFKTTSTTGGKIVSFGDQQTGNSGSYDRHIYMDPQGRVWFGVYNNGSYTVNTRNALNDGQWHHAVGTMDTSGVTLYVDGKKVGHNGGTSVAQPYTGYWRIGGDSAWNGNPYFNGTIDEVAIYPTALTLDQVQKHYTDSGRALSIPPKPTDTYGLAVYNSSPDLYWRVGEPSGLVAKDSSPNSADGAYSGGVTYGTTGAITGTTNTAVTLDGSSGAIATSALVSNPTVYTEELWFKTSTTQGGKLIGFGSNQTGGSNSYDRHVYMFDTGQLRFGVYTGQTNVIDTTQTYNDGAWHYLVASQGADGMKLYVDGVSVGTNPQTQAQAYDGYWRVGGDTTWGGNTSNYFAGSIDEVAVYSSVLSAATVQAHYAAGTGVTPNQPPVAAFTSTVNKLAVSFDGTTSADPDGTIATYAWDFGDGGTSALASPTHTYAAAGPFQVRLTVTDNQGGTNSVTHQVTTVANQAPVAAFTSSSVNLAATFDGTGSSDPDGTIASYAWDFGDGGTSAVASPTHTYAAANTYTVSLTVTDNDGLSTTVTKPVTVSAANQPPVAAFTSSATNLVASFDGGGSSDPDGTISSYAWNFGDNGTSTLASPSHTYTAAGTFQVKLTVTDNQGGTNVVTHQVIVTAGADVPKPDHVVVVVMENHASGAILGSPNAPYINSLAAGGANMTNSFGVTHPSEPNYLALFSGTTQGLTDDSCPHSFTTTNLSDQLIANSLSFMGYSEDLPSVGYTGCSSGQYARKHNPWVNFPSVPSTSNQPFTAFPSDFTTLPTVSFVIPNLQHDMHDGTVNAGDAWLQSNLGAYATWAKSHNSLLVVTFDEDDNTANNQIATVIYGQPVQTDAYNTAISHYSLLRTIQNAYGLPANDGSAAAAPITNIWAAANVPPVAAFTSTSAALTATFDGSASSDPDGTISSYAWNFGDSGTSTLASPTHTYTAAGTYTVSLTVTDNTGAPTTVSHQVKVSAANQPPVAAFASSTADLKATFDSSGSTDPDGTISSYAWDFGDSGTSNVTNPSHTYAAAGTYSVSLTVTDNNGAPTAVTHQVTVSAPAIVTLASDDFGRTISKGWGNADLGGAWSVTSTANSKVSGGVGQLNMAAAGSGPAAYLNGVSSTDMDLETQASLDRLPVGRSNGVVLSVIGRRLSGVGDYRGEARVLATGVVRVGLDRTNAAGVQTALVAETAVAGLTYAPSDVLVLRFQATGTAPTTLRMKVWKLGTPEPTTWQLTTTDSFAGLQAAGGVGVHAYLSSGTSNPPVLASLDSLRAREASTLP